VTASPLQPHRTLHRHGVTLSFFLGDCLEILPRLDRRSIHVVVTSPPYNLGIKYRSYEDTLPRDEYLAWTGRWVREVAEVLRHDGSLFLNVGAKPKDPWVAMDIARAVRPHLELQNTIHWVKSIVIEQDAAGAAAGLTRDLAVGHYKPINSTRFVNDCHEFVFHFSPSGAVPLDRRAIGVAYQDKSNVTRWQSAGSDLRCRGNAWFLPYETINSREKDRPHPATFPVRLPEYCLRLHGAGRGAVVLDPFTGLGSTAVACASLGIDFVGIELDRDYLDEAVARAERALASPPSSAGRKTDTPAAEPGRRRARKSREDADVDRLF
jgi:site-specific DNA-methyltransferase (adenine-specific)